MIRPMARNMPDMTGQDDCFNGAGNGREEET